jgi:hypothetical protein
VKFVEAHIGGKLHCRAVCNHTYRSTIAGLSKNNSKNKI